MQGSKSGGRRYGFQSIQKEALRGRLATDCYELFVLHPPRGLSQPILNGPRQVLLALQLDVGVVVGHVDTAVVGDLAGFVGSGGTSPSPRSMRDPSAGYRPASDR